MKESVIEHLESITLEGIEEFKKGVFVPYASSTNGRHIQLGFNLNGDYVVKASAAKGILLEKTEYNLGNNFKRAFAIYSAYAKGEKVHIPFKIRLEDTDQIRRFQEILFEQGYTWASGDAMFKDFGGRLFLTHHFGEHHPLVLTYTSDENSFCNQKERLITFEQFLQEFL